MSSCTLERTVGELSGSRVTRLCSALDFNSRSELFVPNLGTEAGNFNVTSLRLAGLEFP